MRVRGAARPGCAGAKQASPAFAACGGGAAPRTLPLQKTLQKRCKGSRGRPAEPGKIRQFILSNYYNAAAPEKQRNRRFCNRIVKMPRPPPPAKSPPPPPRIESAIIRPLAPQPRPLQKLRPATGQPRKKIRQFAPGALSRYNNAAKRKNLRIRREPTSPHRQPPQKNPGNLRREPCPVTTAPQKGKSFASAGPPPPPTPAKRSRGEKSPHPPGTHTPTGQPQQKKSGRLSRSATFPLFKRRKMRYTGKEIHPDTEDET